MNKFVILLVLILCSCTTLTRHEQTELQKLKVKGITVDTPQSPWERPANPVLREP